MAKRKLKNEFVVSVAPGSAWYYVFNARTLENYKRHENVKADALHRPGILGHAKYRETHDSPYNLMHFTIGMSDQAKEELCRVIARTILKKPELISKLTELAETNEIEMRELCLDSTYQMDREEEHFLQQKADNIPFEKIEDYDWTLERLRHAPAEHYTGDSRHERLLPYIDRMTKTTDTMRHLGEVLKAGERDDEVLTAILAEGCMDRYLVDIGDSIGIDYGDPRHFDDTGEYRAPSSCGMSFNAVSATLRHIDSYNAARVKEGKPLLEGFTVANSRKGPVKVIHQSVLDRWQEENHGPETPAVG